MMRILLSILVASLFFGTGYSQKPDSTNIYHFKNGRIKGIVLTKDYEMPTSVVSIGRFTPTEEEILKAEKILRKNIRKINKTRPNQFGSNPVIHRRLYSYFRQYVGVINEKGEKVIHINCLWNKYSLVERILGYHDDRAENKKGYSFVFDGGSRYWSININIESSELFGFSVNGVA